MILSIFAETKINNMHFVLSYDLSATGERRSSIEERIDNILSPYRHVRRLTTFFIIHIQNEAQWEAIRSSLISTTPSLRFNLLSFELPYDRTKYSTTK